MATDIYESWSLLPSTVNQPLKYTIIAAAVLRDTLYVISDDNVLRIYYVLEGGNNTNGSLRPRCELIDTINKFTLNIKEKKGSSSSTIPGNSLTNPIRSLHAVPLWNCLTVLHDTHGILCYPLVPSTASNGGGCFTINSKNLPFILPNTKGALSIEPLPSGNMLIVVFPNWIHIYEYILNDDNSSSSSSLAIINEFSLQNFQWYGEHYIFQNDHNNDNYGNVNNDIKSSSSRPSTNSSLSTKNNSSGASSSTTIPSSSSSSGGINSSMDYSVSNPYGRIVRVTWSNPLICLSIIRRRDIPLNNGNGLSSSSSLPNKVRSVSRVSMNETIDTTTLHDTVEEVYLYNAQDVPVSLDTNYELVYVFLHAYTGQVMRRIIAGLAPSLDPVTGLLTIPSITNTNTNDPTTNDINNNIRHQVNQAFMKAVGLQPLLSVPTSSTNKNASSTKNVNNRLITVPWGATAFIADRNDINNEEDEDDMDNRNPAINSSMELLNNMDTYDKESLKDSDGSIQQNQISINNLDSLQFDLPNQYPLTNLQSFAGNINRSNSHSAIHEDDKFITQLQQYIETQEQYSNQRSNETASIVHPPHQPTSRTSTTHSHNSGCIALPIVKEGVAIRGYAPDGSSFIVGEPEMNMEIMIHRSNGKSIRQLLSSVEHANDKFSITTVPSLLYTSPCFPYMLATFPQNIQIYNTRTCSATQTIKLSGIFSVTSCMEEIRIKQKLLSGRFSSSASLSMSNDDDTENSILQRVLSQPERVYLISATGITCLRMMPAMVQIAGLLSRRPPQFEAALALCDTFHMIRQRLTVNSSDSTSYRTETGDSASSVGDSSSNGDAETNEVTTPAWALTLGGVSEAKIKQIRAHFGYTLFAAGDFATALLHLAEAHEPVYRILGLFPQMGLSTKGSSATKDATEVSTSSSSSPSSGTASSNSGRFDESSSTVASNEYPIKMPILIDSLLPIALPPFLHYLLLQRKRCLSSLTKESPPERKPTPLSETNSSTVPISSSPRGLITLIDTYIVTTCLWLERYLFRFTTSNSNDIVQSLSFTNSLTSSPTSSFTHRTVARSQLRIIRKLLKYILSSSVYLSVTDAELLLQSFGKSNDAYTVALYYGQKQHENALRILASVTEATIRTGISLGYPICSTWFTIEDVSRSEPILSAILSLSTYLTNLDKNHTSLVRKFLVPFLDGGAGISGILIGLIVMLQSSCFRCTKGEITSSVIDIPKTLYTLLEIIDHCTYGTDHPQLWTLTGKKLYPLLEQEALVNSGTNSYVSIDKSVHNEVNPVSGSPSNPRYSKRNTTITVFRSLLSCFLRVPTQSMENGNDDDVQVPPYLDSYEHISNLQNEISVLNPPKHGWSRHYAIVLYEYIFSRYTNYPSGIIPSDLDNGGGRGSGSSLSPSENNISNYLHQLIQLYLSTIADICTQLSYQPQKRISDDTGLVREYRERLHSLLRHTVWHPLINASFILSEFEHYRTNDCNLNLYEEQALLLQRLGKHADALRIYIHDIGDFTMAEDYCAMVYQEQCQESGNGISAHFQNSAYIDLLRAYVQDHAIRSTVLDDNTRTNIVTTTGTDLPPPPIPMSAVSYVLKRHPVGNANTTASHQPEITALVNGTSDTKTVLPTVMDPVEQILSALRGMGTKPQNIMENLGISSTYLDTSVTPLVAALGTTDGHGDTDTPSSAATTTSNTVNGIMDILSRNFNRINPTEALPLLPDNVPLAILTPFLTSAMRYSTDHKRMLHSTKALTTYYTTNIRADLVLRQARSVMIEKTSVCSKCHRKLIVPGRNAPSALGIYPNGHVVHSTCIVTDNNKETVTIINPEDGNSYEPMSMDNDRNHGNNGNPTTSTASTGGSASGIDFVNFTSHDDDEENNGNNKNSSGKAPVTRTNRSSKVRGGNNKYESNEERTVNNNNEKNKGNISDDGGVRLVTF